MSNSLCIRIKYEPGLMQKPSHHSDADSSAYLIIDLRKSLFTVQLGSKFVVERVVEHFTEFLLGHVSVGIQHLESIIEKEE